MLICHTATEQNLPTFGVACSGKGVDILIIPSSIVAKAAIY